MAGVSRAADGGGGPTPARPGRDGDRAWELGVRGGRRYGRQLAGYAQILTGEAIVGELALYRRRAHEGPILARPNGNQRAPYAIACKMIAWLPRALQDGAGQASGTLRVQTAKDALLVGVDAHDALRRYPG